MTSDLTEITRLFPVPGTLVGIEAYGSGHINDTFRSTWTEGGVVKRYLHQRINHEVFKDVEGLMRNIALVTKHLSTAIYKAGQDGVDLTLQSVVASDGRFFAKDNKGFFWRTYIYIEGSKDFQVCENPAIAKEAARAIGKFQKYLSDFDISQLIEPIPNFLSSPVRLNNFIQAFNKDSYKRASLAKTEIEFVLARQKEFFLIQNLITDGKIPLRVVHGDTKPNNVLFNEKTLQAICLVDLDTCMPGYSLFDFADLARSAAIPVAEDEQDFKKIDLDFDYFKAIVEGYAEFAASYLNAEEKLVMHKVPGLLALTLGTRFLTDFLEGDKYFKISRENHNLERCRTQFNIVSIMQDNQDVLRDIIRREFIVGT